MMPTQEQTKHSRDQERHARHRRKVVIGKHVIHALGRPYGVSRMPRSGATSRGLLQTPQRLKKKLSAPIFLLTPTCRGISLFHLIRTSSHCGPLAREDSD